MMPPTSLSSIANIVVLFLTLSCLVGIEPAAAAPEIQVMAAGVDVVDGTGSVGFGTTIVGAPLTKTITVSNTGTTDLTLGTITVPTADFTLMTGFGTTTVIPGQMTTFVLQMDAAAAGMPSGVVSFVSDDANENPFDFRVSGTVASSLPAANVIDDGDAGYSATAGWATFTSGGAQGDFDFVSAGSGTETATWTQSGLVAGLYRVSVTWPEFTNRPVDAPYTVLEGTTVLGTAAVDQTLAPVGFTENGIVWQDIGSFQLAGDTLAVRLSDLASPALSTVVADAVRFERTGDLPIGPEVSVSAGGTAILDGIGSLDFGTTAIGAPLNQTITVSNIGTTDLSLGSITLPSTDFMVVSGFGSTILGPTQSTDFVVQMDALIAGTPGGVVSFDSNDLNENPFDINVMGVVVPAMLPTFIIDDGDLDYSATAGWIMFGTSGAQGDFDYVPVGTGSETATWTQPGLVAGLYKVSVTWEASANRAVDAPYTVLDGATVLGTVAVDQTLAPADFLENGILWHDLSSYLLTGDTLAVRLSDSAGPAGSLVVADAVRLERTSTPPTVTITSPLAGGSATAGTPVNLVATASDAEDGDLTAGVVWTSSLDGSLGAGPGGSLTLTDLSVGTHTLTATATDSLMLASSSNVSFTINANVAPTVTITSPPGGGSATAGTPVNLVATANDPEDGDLTAAVVWTSSLDGSLGAGPGGSLTLTDLSVGTHTLTAAVNDSLGLPGNAVVTFTIAANVAPTVTITSPLAGGSATAGTSVNLVATANDPEDGDLTASVDWSSSVDGPLNVGALGGSLTLTNLSVGTHTLTAMVTDSLGLPGSASLTLTINANVAPTVTITSPLAGGSATAGTSVNLVATANDPEDGDLTAGVVWTSNLDGPLGAGPGGSLTLTDLSVGTHTLAAAVNDSLGLPGSDLVIFTVPEPAATASSIASLAAVVALVAVRRGRSRTDAHRE